MSFVKPALGGSRVDLLLDAGAERNRVGYFRFGGYEDRLVGGTAALRYRLDTATSLQAGLKVEGWPGPRHARTHRLPACRRAAAGPLRHHRPPARPDRRGARERDVDALRDGARLDRRLHPRDRHGLGLLRARRRRQLRPGRAARLRLGVRREAAGSGSIPANDRFYVGGLDSVRGYRFHTISPTGGPDGFITGGLSSLSAQLETRIKITDSIGIAPFFDIGGAYTGSVPFSGGATRASAGLGLLYYTPIGPLRVDVATPLDPRRPDQRVVLYVSIGQPF